jgi:F0F1-type ATP synthase assembly protein I
MEERQPNQKREKNKGENGLQAYSRYSAIAIEMAVIIILTSLGGVKLDKAIGTEHLFTVILSLLGVAAAIWLVIREASRNR